jgi:hypothetical protein
MECRAFSGKGSIALLPKETRRDSRAVKLRRSVIFIVTDTHAR